MTARDDLLDLLVEDARHTTADLARMTDLTEDEVEAALADLESEGVVAGYQAIVDWEKTDREVVRATVELNVTLDRETGYGDIAERLARFPQVKTLRLVSGDYDFLMEVEGSSMHDVSIFISEKVAPVPEVTQTVTHYVMTTYKDRGVALNDDDDDDDRLSVSP